MDHELRDSFSQSLLIAGIGAAIVAGAAFFGTAYILGDSSGFGGTELNLGAGIVGGVLALAGELPLVMLVRTQLLLAEQRADLHKEMMRKLQS